MAKVRASNDIGCSGDPCSLLPEDTVDSTPSLTRFLLAAGTNRAVIVASPTPRTVLGMPSRRALSTRLFGIAIALPLPVVLSAQQSLQPMAPSGLTITPAFEGWYKNPDGTFSISFGYLNRNTGEPIDLPVGENNFISPGPQNQGQPTYFAPRRHYGVFAVKVPADFGDQKTVVWTVKFRGKTYAIPGNLKPDWEIDAIQGEASADNTPPHLSFAAGGPEGMGPMGITTGPMTASVGKPLALSVIAKDDAKAEPAARAPAPVDITWFKHQGPGTVTFAPATQRLAATGGTAATSATFSAPGEYLLRVRANDGAVASAGHSQCCWSNAFVRVTVTP